MGKSKIITYVAVTLLIALGLYWGYGLLKQDSSAPVAGGVIVATNQTGLSSANDQTSQFVSILDDIDKIDLQNRLILTNKIFTSLKDFGKTVSERPIGRNNPFAPIGTGETIGSQPKTTETPATDDTELDQTTPESTEETDPRLDILGE